MASKTRLASRSSIARCATPVSAARQGTWRAGTEPGHAIAQPSGHAAAVQRQVCAARTSRHQGVPTAATCAAEFGRGIVASPPSNSGSASAASAGAWSKNNGCFRWTTGWTQEIGPVEVYGRLPRNCLHQRRRFRNLRRRDTDLADCGRRRAGRPVSAGTALGQTRAGPDPTRRPASARPSRSFGPSRLSAHSPSSSQARTQTRPDLSYLWLE
jgi:hypothetical protein